MGQYKMVRNGKEYLCWKADCHKFEFVVYDDSEKIVLPGTVLDVGDNLTCNGEQYTVTAFTPFSPGKFVTLKDTNDVPKTIVISDAFNTVPPYVARVDSRRRLLDRFI